MSWRPASPRPAAAAQPRLQPCKTAPHDEIGNDVVTEVKFDIELTSPYI
jgi:hypothetical protein